MSAPLRWRLVEDEDACGQGELFPERGVLDRHVGTGEYRGLEFLHVRARRIINRVPASARLPFTWTVNAYRGCSHACSYCLAGDTLVLMADGGRRPLAALRVGDRLWGTVPRGGARAWRETAVLARWSTVGEAYRLRLADGTELVASGDHRFLTDLGWRQVAPGTRGPSLVRGDRLVGPGPARAGVPSPAGALAGGGLGAPSPEGAPAGGHGGPAVPPRSSPGLAVAAVERLGRRQELVDITTGTGDFVANGVIAHNCFARPTHEWLGLDSGEDFERRIVVKVNAVERVRAEVASRRWHKEPIAMGTNTDPYQRAEGKYRLTRGIIEALGETANPFSILTKSTLILADLDRLVAASRRASVRVNLSIATLDEEVWRLTEPGTPHPRQRVAAVRRLNEAGVPCGVLLAPVLPGLSDDPEGLAAVVSACVDAGAVSVTPVALHLRPGVREHYLAWLGDHRPDLVAAYHRRYPGNRAYLPRREQEDLARAVEALVADRRRGSG
ncbi:MAG TPA: radical SAM protein [Acidimicrobiales bacterium]|nr:radical SAM protein [Acidimicrobiales bacterium]